jgi:RNA polymerase sigma factor (sigma-70 family)
MERLTDKEREMVERAFWVVNTILKTHNQQHNEDLRSEANFYLCRCAKRYRNDCGAKWETFAYSNLDLWVRREIRKSYKSKKSLPLNSPCLADKGDSQLQTLMRVEELTDLKEMCKCLNEREKTILRLKFYQYSNVEIKEELGISTTVIKRYFKKLKEKIKENAYEMLKNK